MAAAAILKNRHIAGIQTHNRLLQVQRPNH